MRLITLASGVLPYSIVQPCRGFTLKFPMAGKTSSSEMKSENIRRTTKNLASLRRVPRQISAFTTSIILTLDLSPIENCWQVPKQTVGRQAHHYSNQAGLGKCHSRKNQYG